MKAFLASLVAAAVITGVAAFALQSVERTTAEVFSSENVRL